MAAAGCSRGHASFVRVDDVALGRVVIYRNGVAFYERRATVSGGVLTITVPRERVDDFLKSLTVVDAVSHQALPVSIPRHETNDGVNLVMQLQVPTKNPQEPSDVVLTYVTESPAWKPSYRVVVGDHNDVMLEGWAIVDNTSGEDWKNVLVGVGSSSALSFHYDLWSVRQVQRETLSNEERFAVAPPTGVSPYGAMAKPSEAEVVSELDDTEIRRPPGHPEVSPTPQLTDAELAKLAEQEAKTEVITVTGSLIERKEINSLSPVRVSGRRDLEVPQAASKPATAPPPLPAGVAMGDVKIQKLAAQLAHTDKQIVIEGTTQGSDPASSQRAIDRGNLVRNQLIDHGVAPGRIVVVSRFDPSQPEHVRLLTQTAPAASDKPSAQGARAAALDAPPVGESHFENTRPMSVERGSSAMVSMVRSVTEGEVVYLYDAESERGNARFAFRAVRFKNPTDSTLETGPVTVFGNERFIGEGLTEPIPPKASAVVPFALDRQIVVERSDGEDDKLSRLVTLQRGILTAEVQHVRHQKLTLTNRLPQPAKVFIRHTLNKGWTLLEAPKMFERVGDAHLFQIELQPGEIREVTIAQATPIERTLDLSAGVSLDMMKVWVDAPDGAPELKDQLRKLLAIHKSLADGRETELSLRRRLNDYRARMDELHVQLVSLQAVKTSNDLTSHLRAKMKEISDLVQKTTIQIVDQEEQNMLGRVRFQNALAELTLPDAAAAVAAKPGH